MNTPPKIKEKFWWVRDKNQILTEGIPLSLTLTKLKPMEGSWVGASRWSWVGGWGNLLTWDTLSQTPLSNPAKARCLVLRLPPFLSLQGLGKAQRPREAQSGAGGWGNWAWFSSSLAGKGAEAVASLPAHCHCWVSSSPSQPVCGRQAGRRLNCGGVGVWA